MGLILFMLLCTIELLLLMMQMKKKKVLQKEKAILYLSEFICMGGYFFIERNIVGFRGYLLLIILITRSIVSTFILLLKKDREYRMRKGIMKSILQVILIGFGMFFFFLFPIHPDVVEKEGYPVETISYTWEDESRLETFAKDGSNRKVTVQFWYPKTTSKEIFPLVVFSHGAFGYRMSNYSLYQKLAQNGYVICSIDHTFHAFFTNQTDGKIIRSNPDFIKEVYKINDDKTTEDEIFSITRKWMKLRTQDMNFVIDTIKEKTRIQEKDQVFSEINDTKIGVIGHSLGGATAVSIGRQRSDIKAVINLDATMLAEELDCVNNVYVINQEPYPVPLLCIDTTKHYEQGLKFGDLYVNNVVLKKAKDAKEIHFNQAGHLNFTDLPLYSPILASLLDGSFSEKGKVDPASCIKTMNEVILNYYNHYLKNIEEFNSKESY